MMAVLAAVDIVVDNVFVVYKIVFVEVASASVVVDAAYIVVVVVTGFIDGVVVNNCSVGVVAVVSIVVVVYNGLVFVVVVYNGLVVVVYCVVENFLEMRHKRKIGQKSSAIVQGALVSITFNSPLMSIRHFENTSLVLYRAFRASQRTQ